jgi:maltose alpha-D-glucosyltransferase/alpha-amylase
LKRLRKFVDENYPGRILLCEANQWPQDVRQYFGNGDEFHLGFHFPLMPRIFMAIGEEDVSPLVWVMERTPPIPDSCQWCTFLRNHDELTLEMVTEEERQWMWEKYAPDHRMRLNLGIRRRLAPLLDNDRRKIELAYSLLFSLPGSPTIYYGDEIGMGDNIWLRDRNGVRTPMQWDDSENAGFSLAPSEKLYTPVIQGGDFDYHRVNVRTQELHPGSLLNWLRNLIKVRKENPAFGAGRLEMLPVRNKSVLVYFRRQTEQTLLIIINLSSKHQQIVVDLDRYKPFRLLDLFSKELICSAESGTLRIELGQHAYRWFRFL